MIAFSFQAISLLDKKNRRLTGNNLPVIPIIHPDIGVSSFVRFTSNYP
jgi:hypothetical protein